MIYRMASGLPLTDSNGLKEKDLFMDFHSGKRGQCEEKTRGALWNDS